MLFVGTAGLLPADNERNYCKYIHGSKDPFSWERRLASMTRMASIFEPSIKNLDFGKKNNEKQRLCVLYRIHSYFCTSCAITHHYRQYLRAGRYPHQCI